MTSGAARAPDRVSAGRGRRRDYLLTRDLLAELRPCATTLDRVRDYASALDASQARPTTFASSTTDSAADNGIELVRELVAAGTACRSSC